MGEIKEINDSLRGEADEILESSGLSNYSVENSILTIYVEAMSYFHETEFYARIIREIVALQIYEVVLIIK